MAGMKNMLASFSLLHEGMSTLNTNQIYRITHSTNASGRRTTIKPPIFLSSRKKKLTTVVKASLDMDALEEEAKVDVCSDIKVIATVNIKISKEDDAVNTMMKLPWLHDSSKKGGVGFQLVSTQLDQSTNKPKQSKESVKDWPKCTTCIDNGIGGFCFNVELLIDADFGEPGAILLKNYYDKELYVENISLESFFHFSCNSWIQPTHISNETRIFFANKAYLPSQTPKGLKYLRAKELKNKRGDGNGLRLPSDRIYDYDTYNDIGNPDKGVKFARPTLGGERNPHPRRLRTGRPSTNTDVTAEKPVNTVTSATYVPRDEALEGMRRTDILMGIWKGLLHNIPPIVATLYNKNGVCSDFTDLTSLYRKVPPVEMGLNMSGLLKILDISASVEDIFKFKTPKNMSRNATSYIRDDELGRQTLSGMNPVSLKKLKVFPPVSKLDPSMYGPPESDLKEEHIIGHLNGMSVQQALDENKLFVLDYHDIYLPFLERINAQEGRKTYGTRTIFFLTTVGTLKPIAIELGLHPSHDSNISSKQVLTPPVDATTNWLWQLGKAHVCSNDAGVHQLVHHWLRVHACMEPFIIATHRNLSSLHPVFKLLSPHMRHTLAINAMARESLLSAEGIIECGFSTGEYSMEMACAAYRDWWRFDLEGLPADLIRRGMAVPDETKPHGLRLLIEDYPYANDGLLIWSAIHELVNTYVNHYYPDETAVISDTELQSWYNEAINVGHADLREATWWPKLRSPEKLTEILTILIWTSSAQHAALNFGQYNYGGYVPNRPPLMRKLLPQQHDDEYASFIADPEGYFLSSLPSLFQSTRYMAVIDIISAHSQDEEYLGDIKDVRTNWPGEPKIIEAFYRFSMKVKDIEIEIKRRNSVPMLRNRCGAGVPPYELLVPTSESGVTGRGIPNSITI